jgi:hypothetical protein
MPHATSREAWQHFASAIGGQYFAGNWRRSRKVVAAHGPWTLTLDTYTVATGESSTTYTRLRAPYVSADGFRFTVYRRSLFTPLGKFFGMQDIETGRATFDQAFVVKSNSELRIRRVLDNARLRELIERQASIDLRVKDNEGWFGTRFPQSVDELYFQAPEVITDESRLRELFELFTVTLDELRSQHLAHDVDPHLELR